MQRKTVPPPTWKAAVVKWVGIFPSVLLISYLIKQAGVKQVVLKLFIETILLVPFLTFIMTPLMKKIFSDWLYKGMKVKEDEPVDIGS